MLSIIIGCTILTAGLIIGFTIGVKFTCFIHEQVESQIFFAIIDKFNNTKEINKTNERENT